MTDFVVHCKKSPYDVYVGRPGPWANPFSHRASKFNVVKVDSAEDAVACFEAWIATQPELIERAKRELKDKVLGCWCSEKQPCHARVLAKIANE